MPNPCQHICRNQFYLWITRKIGNIAKHNNYSRFASDTHQSSMAGKRTTCNKLLFPDFDVICYCYYKPLLLQNWQEENLLAPDQSESQRLVALKGFHSVEWGTWGEGGNKRNIDGKT